MSPRHKERHPIKSIGWLRAAVLGANDPPPDTLPPASFEARRIEYDVYVPLAHDLLQKSHPVFPPPRGRTLALGALPRVPGALYSDATIYGFL